MKKGNNNGGGYADDDDNFEQAVQLSNSFYIYCFTRKESNDSA